MDSALNVATPLTAVTVVVPLSVPPPALVPIASVTLELSPVTTMPPWSSTVTVTAGAMVCPAVVLLGSAVKTSCVGVPGTHCELVYQGVKSTLGLILSPVPAGLVGNVGPVGLPQKLKR